MKVTLDCELTDGGCIVIKKTEDISVEDFNKAFSEGHRFILEEVFYDDEMNQIPGQMNIYDFL